jgi:hypothetical protein
MENNIFKDMKYSFKILAITVLALMATSCYFKVPKNGEKSIFRFTRGDGNVIDKEYVVEPFDKIHNRQHWTSVLRKIAAQW